MLKKYSIVALFLFAYTIVLAHSIVPHHHHHCEDHLTEQTAHHHNDHDDENDMEHAFENYIHADGEENNYHQPVIKIPVQQIASVYLICDFTLQIQAVEATPPIARRSNDHIPVPQHSLSPKGLRAPPICLA